MPHLQCGLCLPGVGRLWGDGRAVGAVGHSPPSPPGLTAPSPSCRALATKAQSCLPVQGLPLAEKRCLPPLMMVCMRNKAVLAPAFRTWGKGHPGSKPLLGPAEGSATPASSASPLPPPGLRTLPPQVLA